MMAVTARQWCDPIIFCPAVRFVPANSDGVRKDFHNGADVCHRSRTLVAMLL